MYMVSFLYGDVAPSLDTIVTKCQVVAVIGVPVVAVVTSVAVLPQFKENEIF